MHSASLLEYANSQRVAAGSVVECIFPLAHRSFARSDLSPPVDIDTDFLLRRTGDVAGRAADRSRADARRANANGPIDRNGNRAIRIIFAAHRRLAGPGAKVAGVHYRRT